MEERGVLLCALSKVALSEWSKMQKVIKQITMSCPEDVDPLSILFNNLGSAPDSVVYRELYNSLTSIKTMDWAKKEYEWCAKNSVDVLYSADKKFPKLLHDCADSPIVLFCRGCTDLNTERIISVVGTRLASLYGKESCANIISYMAKNEYNPLIVSGLAYGIDISAHIAALRNELKTVAVMACGLDKVYPERHTYTARQIIEAGGAIVSEYPSGTEPLKINFIKRNRIIAGLAQAVAVIETRVRGGAMSTVEFANSYCREVFAMPGRITDTNSYGCNYLIYRNMAKILNSVETIPENMGWRKESSVFANQPELFNMADDERYEINREKILSIITSHKMVFIEDICKKCGLLFSEASMLLLEMEMKGEISAVGRGFYQLAK